MKTNTKEVREAIKKHIEEYHEEEGLQLFRENVKAVKWGHMTDYQAVKEYVAGGGLLIYTSDIVDFFKELGIHKEGFDEMATFELYQHLIAREGVKML